jgi:hypothetical protein
MTAIKSMAAIIGIETRALWLAGAVEESPWSGRPHIGLDVCVAREGWGGRGGRRGR